MTELLASDDSRVRVMVFSHPNHEIAVYGLLQRLRPWLIFLTDGGGEHRVAETRRGLERVGLAERAHFLDHSEESHYSALLERDVDFFRGLAAQVEKILVEIQPDQVFCDAVETYNPVHDVTLPLVRRALADREVALFEVPLVYQRPAKDETYVVQRLPDSQRARRVDFVLDDAEVDAKIAARDEVYSCLSAQMGPVLQTLSRDHVALETLGRVGEVELEPAPDRVLRYEWRGALLREQGTVERVITWADHYRPVADALGS